mgnify:FL=1
MLVLGLILPLLASHSILGLADRTVAAQIEADMDGIASGLRYIGGRWELVVDPYLVTTLVASDPGDGFVVIDEARHVVAASRGGREAIARIGGLPFADGSVGSGPVAYSTRVVRSGRQRALVMVYRDRWTANAAVDQAARDIMVQFGALTIAALALMLAINLATIIVSMAGLRRAAREAASIGPDAPGCRINRQDLPDEVLQLVDAANAALDRVEDGHRMQAQFAGAVAHELRTPLALLRVKCECLPASPEREDLLKAVDRQSHILRQLTALASLDGMRPAMTRLDLVETIREMATDLSGQVIASRRTIEFSGPDFPVWVRGNADCLFSILSNLIGNAVRHTPVGTHIAIRVGRDGSVMVADDGPGILRVAGEARAARYLRADRRRSDGAGMGLRIVEKTAGLLGGRMEIATDAAGAAVTIWLRADRG